MIDMGQGAWFFVLDKWVENVVQYFWLEEADSAITLVKYHAEQMVVALTAKYPQYKFSTVIEPYSKRHPGESPYRIRLTK